MSDQLARGNCVFENGLWTPGEMQESLMMHKLQDLAIELISNLGGSLLSGLLCMWHLSLHEFKLVRAKPPPTCPAEKVVLSSRWSN